MSKYKPIFKKVGLFLLISISLITVIMGISFWSNDKNPTYENVPYTVEEARDTDIEELFFNSTGGERHE